MMTFGTFEIVVLAVILFFILLGVVFFRSIKRDKNSSV